ncbi:hypothetical protein KIN20_021607 [Parelaphostrongylus tenuis]|uniref:Uncharacterized protein n=1 Tax=Parelaphostrongylus tenuis TaxID=148309 RepID=A0AAD5QWB0_PARTN|nr:hypothetical protein KIN20_021607 [Parelaphostrongylus tenuis]
MARGGARGAVRGVPGGFRGEAAGKQVKSRPKEKLSTSENHNSMKSEAQLVKNVANIAQASQGVTVDCRRGLEVKLGFTLAAMSNTTTRPRPAQACDSNSVKFYIKTRNQK